MAKHDAVINKKKNAQDIHWVWKDKRRPATANGAAGIVAKVTKKPAPNPNDIGEIKIWVYKAVPTNPTIPNVGTLQLSETYQLSLLDTDEVNNRGNKNKTFHYKLTSPITTASGQPVNPSPGTRTFLITGTREVGNPNTSRSFRVTTFITTPGGGSGPTPSPTPPPEDLDNCGVQVGNQLFDCIDYPDDAVLDEEEHPLVTSPGMPDQPDPTYPDDPNATTSPPWISYSW